jgi:hypothetical protein
LLVFLYLSAKHPPAEAGGAALVYRLTNSEEVALAIAEPSAAFARAFARVVALDLNYPIRDLEAGRVDLLEDDLLAAFGSPVQDPSQISKQFLYESELYTSRGPKRMVGIFEPSRVFDTPLIMSLKNPRFPRRSRPRFPQLLNTALNALVADKRTVDAQRTQQAGQWLKWACTHRGQESRTSQIGPPP